MHSKRTPELSLVCLRTTLCTREHYAAIKAAKKKTCSKHKWGRRKAVRDQWRKVCRTITLDWEPSPFQSLTYTFRNALETLNKTGLGTMVNQWTVLGSKSYSALSAKICERN